MCRRIITGAVILGILCAVIAAAIVFLPALLGKPVTDASSSFIQALKNQDYAAAYSMGDPTFQQQYRTAAGLQSQFNGFVPTSWTIDSFSVQNNQGTATASVTLTTNQKFKLTFALQNINGAWKISSFNIAPG